MKIVLDFDDVIADTFPVFLKNLNEYQQAVMPGGSAHPWTMEDFKTWDAAGTTGFTQDTIDKLFKGVDWRLVKPVAHAVDTIKDLWKQGHELMCLTANPNERDIRNWLDVYGLTNLGLLVETEKVAWMDNHGYQAIVDDNPKTLLEASNRGFISMRFKRPWNGFLEDWGRKPTEKNVDSWYGAWRYFRMFVQGNTNTWEQVKKAVNDHFNRDLGYFISNTIVNNCPTVEEAMDEVVTNDQGAKQSRIDGRWDLLPMRAMQSVTRVLSEGADKYGIDNWRGLSVDEINNHVWAHLATWQLNGDLEDLEHAAVRILMALEVEKGGGNER